MTGQWRHRTSRLGHSALLGLALAAGSAMPAWCQSASARVTLPPLDQAAEPPTELHTTAPLGQSLRSQPTATVPRFFSSNRPVILDVPRLDAEPGAPAEPPGPSAPAGSPPAR